MKISHGFPLYVKLGLLGIHSRKQALIQQWLSVGISLALLSLGLHHDSLFWTTFFAATTLLTFAWYWSCIRWVDRHAKWEDAQS